MADAVAEALADALPGLYRPAEPFTLGRKKVKEIAVFSSGEVAAVVGRGEIVVLERTMAVSVVRVPRPQDLFSE